MRLPWLLVILPLLTTACAHRDETYATAKVQLLSTQQIFQNPKSPAYLTSEIHIKAAGAGGDACTQAINPLLDQASEGLAGLSAADAAALSTLASAAASGASGGAPSAPSTANDSTSAGSSGASPNQDTTAGSSGSLANGPTTPRQPALPFGGQPPGETPPQDPINGSTTAGQNRNPPTTQLPGSGLGHPIRGPTQGANPPDTVSAGLGAGSPPKDIVSAGVATKQTTREGFLPGGGEGGSDSSHSSADSAVTFGHSGQTFKTVSRTLASSEATISPVGKANGPGLFKILSTTYDHLCRSDRLKSCRRFAESNMQN